MNQYTLEQLLKGIKNRDNTILTEIYREYFPIVRSYISNNKGNEHDAKDVFQEALIVIYKAISNNKLEISQSFQAFLLGTCKLLWLKILRGKDIHERNLKHIEKPEHDSILNDDMVDDQLETRLFRKHFLNLGEDCRKVLSMSIDGVPYSQIQKEMGYSSEKFARNKKSRCKEYLAKMIKADPEFISRNK